MRSMYATAWLGAVDRVANDQTGPWRELREFPELTGGGGGEARPTPAEAWEIDSPLLPCSGPVELGMLQMLAAVGRLKQTDRIRRVPDGDWQEARAVAGVFGGRRSWCMACGGPLRSDPLACQTCGASQPDSEQSFATVAFVCGLVSIIWLIVAFLAVTALAWRRVTVLGVDMTEWFPHAYAVLLIGPLWLALVAVILGHGARDAVSAGRSPPANAEQAEQGEHLGLITLCLLLLIGVGVAAFSLPYFHIVS
jgi:hypothetical protein